MIELTESSRGLLLGPECCGASCRLNSYLPDAFISFARFISKFVSVWDLNFVFCGLSYDFSCLFIFSDFIGDLLLFLSIFSLLDFSVIFSGLSVDFCMISWSVKELTGVELSSELIYV